MRRRLCLQEASPQHGKGGVDRGHHVPHSGGPIDYRDGSRAAAQRTGAPASQPPRSPTRQSDTPGSEVELNCYYSSVLLERNLNYSVDVAFFKL